ncbi:MAG: YccF domain-containing protein [Myxococcota bacterium]|nr:YccF domain-containing protein [Myxococcota bacterium]
MLWEAQFIVGGYMIRIMSNVVWIVFGGSQMALAYMTAGLAFCITIIGIPFGLQFFKLGVISFWPFGTKLLPVKKKDNRKVLHFVCNVIWMISFGLVIALGHLFWALLFGITILGIPFALQHIKLAKIALMPFGRDFDLKE